MPPMGTHRKGAVGLCANDHQFLAIGGISGQSGSIDYLSSCEYYDTQTEEWEDLDPDMPHKRAFGGATQIGSQIFVLGGKASKDVEISPWRISCVWT